MHPVITGSQDHLGMLRSHHIAMQNGTLNTFGCVIEIVMLVLVTVILMYS